MADLNILIADHDERTIAWLANVAELSCQLSEGKQVNPLIYTANSYTLAIEHLYALKSGGEGVGLLIAEANLNPFSGLEDKMQGFGFHLIELHESMSIGFGREYSRSIIFTDDDLALVRAGRIGIPSFSKKGTKYPNLIAHVRGYMESARQEEVIPLMRH